jgi:Domain of unknown function (DUF4265)
MSEHKKIRFEIEGNTADEMEVESLWALERHDGFEIDNIPFYARGVALGDVVATRADGDGLLWFDHVVRTSGHSTIRLWFAREDDVKNWREMLRNLGCSSEISDLSRLVAVDVPPEVEYERVKGLLEEGEAVSLLEYEEGCLGFSQ